MKKMLLLLLLIYNVFALDTTSSIPKDQKEVIDRIIMVLQLQSNKNTKEIIFNKLNGFFEEDWSAHWTTNTTGSGSRIEYSETQICDVTIYNNNRVTNCTFVISKRKNNYL